jgi:hypothetical protein
MKAWGLWWRGNKDIGVPPFKVLNGRDMLNRNQEKLLSEWKTLFNHIKVLLEAQGHWTEFPNDLELGTMYAQAMESLPCSQLTNRKRKRRPGQLHLTSILRLLRQEAKRKQTQRQ